MRIAVLMTCFNRKQTTLDCLEHLVSCKWPTGVEYDVWLNDDGCTDGTADAVKRAYPRVHIVSGSGYDYWCGGMRRAWKTAIQSDVVYDGYIWLNDDTLLDESAIELLLEQPEILTAGAICSRDRTTFTYGGFDGKGSPVGPMKTEMCNILTFNGNCVWVPRNVFEKIGGLSEFWSHAMGDVDYGRRACEAGFKVLLTRDYVGTCDRNLKLAVWTRPEVSLVERLKNLYSPLSYGTPTELFRYCWVHDGPMIALRNLISQYVRVFFPKLWRHR